MKWIFVLSVLALGWTYLGYPLAMLARALYRPRRVQPADWEPDVAVVIVAHDAADELAAKLRNIAALDYPPGKLRFHVASDGSEDHTPTVLREFGDPRLIPYVFPVRRGKSACLGDIVPRLEAEVVLFADARQRIEPGALRALLRLLSDPRVGAVGGELAFERSYSDYGDGIDFYWRYETFIRGNEAESGSVVGVSGALYAARRALLPQIPAGLILDDLWIPLQIARDGSRIVFSSEARAWDRPSKDAAVESARKRRTLAGNFQLIAREPALLLPWAHPLGWRLWGHKWLRLLAPWFMLAAFASNIVLISESPKWTLLGLAQIAFYGVALAAMRRPSLLRIAPVRVISTFVRMNGYAVLGLHDFLTGRASATWSVSRRRNA
ncbi:glycosyltransferase [Dokdonella sp.]|uniref:glycosyltransferase n=1 Tax=Dokdonella sp. TaxID=2291710 RepID=UPI002F404ED3